VLLFAVGAVVRGLVSLLEWRLSHPSYAQAGANRYVWCGATGTGTGADFTNASTDLPTNLPRGDTYVVAGSDSCQYAPHSFDDAVSGTTVITVRKAVAASDSGVAGWQASFATAPAVWTLADKADPESGTVPLWKICSSYYNIDGMTGTIDPPAGGPSGQGFVVKSRNFFVIGLVAITNNSCSHGSSTHSSITIRNTEISGVDRYLSAAIRRGSCSFSGGVTTVTLSPTPSWTPIAGNTVDANTAVQGGKVIPGSNNVRVTNVSSWPSVSFASSSNPCATMGALSLNFGGSVGLYIINRSDTYDNLTISDNYIHDVAGSPLGTSGCTGNCVYRHNFFARNRYTPTQHANGIDSHPGLVDDNGVTLAYNYWVDIQGTAFVNVLNSGTPGHADRWNIYGNIFWLTDNTANIISQGITCSNGNPCNSWNIFNNTFYNITNASSSARIMCNNAGATTWQVFNNMWVHTINQRPLACSGTIIYDESSPSCASAPICEDYSYFDGNTNAVGSDAHGQKTKADPDALFRDPSAGDFTLQAHTKNMLNTHALLAANDTDLAGTSRCVGVGCPGRSTNWDAGALQFVGGGAAPATPLSPQRKASRGQR